MNIKNRKKDERRVAPVADVEELLRVMEGHGERTLFTYYVGKATQDMTYAAFTHRVRALAAGLHCPVCMAALQKGWIECLC